MYMYMYVYMSCTLGGYPIDLRVSQPKLWSLYILQCLLLHVQRSALDFLLFLTPFTSEASTASLVARAPVEWLRRSNQLISCRSIAQKVFRRILFVNLSPATPREKF